jgi:outer membrane protein
MKTWLAVGLLAGVAASAQGHEAGDFIVRVGAGMVEPRESSGQVLLNNAVLSLKGGTSGLGVNGNTQLALTFTYMLTPNLGVEVLAATPFEHDAFGTGELAGLKIANAKQLPPTVSVVYHFATDSAWQPYVGVGFNYTVFFEEDITSNAATTLAGLGLRNGKLSIDESAGLAAQVGMDYQLANRWLLNASLRWVDIDTQANIKFASGQALKADLEIDPLVYTLAVGYSF